MSPQSCGGNITVCEGILGKLPFTRLTVGIKDHQRTRGQIGTIPLNLTTEKLEVSGQ
jgi:hypothetical protein